MADEQWVSMTMAKWLSAGLAMVAMWAGSIEQRLRGKPGREEIARNPVEGDTFTAVLSEVTTSLNDIKAAQTESGVTLVKLGTDVATLMERTAK